MRWWILVVNMLLLSASARAEPEQPLPARVTWPELVQLVRARSPRLRSVTAQAQVASAEVDVALRIPNPVVSYLGYGRLQGTNESINGSQHQIEIDQDIPLWGQRRARRDVAKASVILAERGASKLQNEVFAQARLTFVSLLVAQAELARVTDAQSRMSALRTLIEGRVATGLLGAFELQRILLEEKRFRIAKDRAQARAERLAGELAALVGEPTWLPEAVGELSLGPSSGPASTQAEAPDVALARAEERAARVNVELIDRERLPGLTLSAGAYFTTHGDSTSLIGGVAMPIPAFDTGRALQEKARRESIAARAELSSVEAENAAQKRVAARELVSLESAYASFAEDTPKQLEQLRTMAEQSYRAGAVGLNVLLETLRAEVEAQLELLELQRDLLIADVRVRVLSGRAAEP